LELHGDLNSFSLDVYQDILTQQEVNELINIYQSTNGYLQRSKYPKALKKSATEFQPIVSSLLKRKEIMTEKYFQHLRRDRP
jgi:hypothetical protein